MEVRDAVEADAGRLASLTDAPRDVMRNLVHDRTVRVAVEPRERGDSDADDRDDAADIRGFVSFDARERTVHVTQLEGDPAVHDLLLAEPVQFAEGERMAVEMLVPEDESDVRNAAVAAGFDDVGNGPQFGEQPTRKYRLEPST